MHGFLIMLLRMLSCVSPTSDMAANETNPQVFRRATHFAIGFDMTLTVATHRTAGVFPMVEAITMKRMVADGGEDTGTTA